MDSFLMIAQVLALIAVTVLCVYLIMLAVRARDFLSSLEKDIKEMTSRAVPVLDHLEVVTSRLKAIAENVDDQVAAVRESIVSVKAIATTLSTSSARCRSAWRVRFWTRSGTSPPW